MQTFISHTSKDDAFVKKLRQSLELHNISVWADSRELSGGDLLDAEIEKAIEASSAFLLIISQNALLKPRWVRKETRKALAIQAERGADKYRIVPMLCDGLGEDVLETFFEKEPVAIKISTDPKDLEEATLKILTALGLQLPDDITPAEQPAEESVSELILVLEEPTLFTEGGVRRGSGRAQLEFHPADGGEVVESKWFRFISPLGPDVADRIRRYIEEYPRYPFLQKMVADIREVEGQLPGWGEALFKAISGEESALSLLLEWKGDRQHERRFSIKLDAALPDALPEEQKTDFLEATTLLLSTPWEILHDGRNFLFQGQQPVRVRRMQPNRKRRDPLPLQKVLRILLVVPRPEDETAGLIDHRAATRALLAAVDTLGSRVELQILESPTFPALRDRLREANKAGRPFSVVHFDGHGVFDKNRGLGALCFESAEAAEQEKIEGRATAIVDAQELAAELDELRIPLFFLDACQSAQTDHDPTASVAAKLLENGVASVAAMSHSVLVTAAECFATAFYKRLAEGSLIGAAMLAGQQALYDDPVRAELPGGEKLRLRDWFVPVLFQEKKDPQLVREIPGKKVQQVIETERAALLGATPPAPEHGFVGRTRELLALERLLLRERFAVLVGTGGAGKTTLATELARWLLRTRRFGRLAFVSFEDARDVRTVIDVLGKQLVASDFSVATFENDEKALLKLDRCLSDYNTLIVLDNLESILPDIDGNTPLGVEVFDQFAVLFSRLEKVNAAMLLTSREQLPAPFDAVRNHVRLSQLSPSDALRLIAEVRKAKNMEVPSLNVEDLDKQFGALARNANYHARALTLLAQLIPDNSSELSELNADLSLLMADLERKHPGERENSLFASLELSLRRLPPAMREVVDALAVYHGGADVATWAKVAAREQKTAYDAGIALIQVGLAEYAYDQPPYYFKIDPSLPAYLAARTASEILEARRLRWVEGMVALNGFLYEQLSQDTQIAYDLCRLTEANLLAMLAALPQHAVPDQIVTVAQSIETLYSPLGRPQVVLFAQNIREKAAQSMSNWNHAQYLHLSAMIDRFLEQSLLNAAYPMAQQVLVQCESAGARAYPEAEYDWAMAHLRLGRVLKRGGRPEQALPYLENAERRLVALAEARGVGDTRMASVCLVEMGDCFRVLGKYDAAVEQYERNIALAEKLGDTRQVAVGQGQLATIRMLQKNYPEALRLHHEAKVIFEQYREPAMVATAWHQIGMVHQEAGNYPASETAYRDSLAIEIREKNKAGEAMSLIQLGNLYKDHLDRLENSVQVYERAVSIFVELKDLRYEGLVRSNLADCQLQLRRPAEARDQLLRAIECKSTFGHVATPWTTWAILCDLETTEGNPSAAAAARQKAMLTYAAYRKDGGESRANQFNFIMATAQALQSGDQLDELIEYLQSTLEPGDPTTYVALIRALLALLRGDPDPTLTDDPDLHYMDAVELNLVFFGAGG
ncbi:MAG: tetratricopeptide repeat protein [Saprospiraceae bacterium]